MNAKERRLYRKSRGLCLECMRPATVEYFCQPHFERSKKGGNEKKRYATLRDAGLCVDCGIEAVVGQSRCQMHIDAVTEASRQHTERNREAVNEQHAFLREQRRQSRQCLDCYAPVVEGRRRCAEHLAANNNARKKAVPQNRYAAAKYQARRLAKRTPVFWGLTEEEFYSIVSEPCEYCGLENEVTTATGLDRLDNTLGYILGNVVSCCTECNLARGDRFSPQAMRDIIGPALRKAKLERDYIVWNAEYFAAMDEERRRNFEKWGLE